MKVDPQFLKERKKEKAKRNTKTAIADRRKTVKSSNKQERKYT